MRTLSSALLLFITLGFAPPTGNTIARHYVITITSEDKGRQIDFAASYILSGDGNRMTLLDVKKTPFRLEVDAEVLYFISQGVTRDAMMTVGVYWVDAFGKEVPWGFASSNNGIAVVIDYENPWLKEDGRTERKPALRVRGL